MVRKEVELAQGPIVTCSAGMGSYKDGEPKQHSRRLRQLEGVVDFGAVSLELRRDVLQAEMGPVRIYPCVPRGRGVVGSG